MSYIFLADDDVDDRDALKEALQVAGSSYPVVEAEDGEQAILLLNNLKEEGTLPCLVILDVNMPKIDGREIFHFLKADKVLSTVPVVFYTTSSVLPHSSVLAFTSVPFIAKPFSHEDFAQVAALLLAYCTCRPLL